MWIKYCRWGQHCSWRRICVMNKSWSRGESCRNSCWSCWGHAARGQTCHISCFQQNKAPCVETRVVQAPPLLPERHEVTGIAEDCYCTSGPCWWIAVDFMCQESKGPSPPEEKIWTCMKKHGRIAWIDRTTINRKGSNRVILQNSTYSNWQEFKSEARDNMSPEVLVTWTGGVVARDDKAAKSPKNPSTLVEKRVGQ